MRNRDRRFASPSHAIADLQTQPCAHVTVQAFAAYLGLDERTVLKWIDAGVLPAFRFPPRSGGWRIKTVDALAFVERSRFQV